MTADHRPTIPGPSFIREERIRLRADDRSVQAGMSTPSIMEDGWWLTHLWVADGQFVVDAIELAPTSGPPPGTPVARLGPSMAGALSGLLGEEGGRQLIRLRMPPAPDETRPWHRPMLMWVAIKWDPVRASVMRPNELARELLRGFAAAVESAGRPG